MKNIVRFPVFLVCLLAPAFVAFAEPPAAVPAALEVPADQSLALTLTAKGVQIYECRPSPTGPAQFEWVFKAPEADLFDAQGHKVGRHFAGPTWELTDGGKVVGKVEAKADAPDGRGVPWLLLEATEASGTVMGKVRSIQRVNTAGGNAPAARPDPAQAGKQLRVDYTATYRFYVARP